MTKEEFNQYIEDLKDPDKQPEAIVNLTEGVTNLYEENAVYQDQRIHDQERIRGLQELNARLALRITGNGGENDEEKKEDPEKTEEELTAEATKIFEDLGKEYE